MQPTKSKYVYLLVGVAVLAGGLSSAAAKDVEEKFDDGTLKLRYRTDAKDRKNGDYLENFPTGKPHIRGTYSADKKSGTWTTYGDNGKPIDIAAYKNDQLDGPYQWNFPSGSAGMKTAYRAGTITGGVTTFSENGGTLFSLSYPIAWDAVQKAWKTLNPAERSSPKMLSEPKMEVPYKAGRMADESQQAALKYMTLYRFLSGVPIAGMSIDADYADKAQHGAVVLAKVGHLSHTPDRPADMDSDFFKIGYAGTSSSNISQGRDNLFDSIDDYMNDSDEGNVKRVGHRQWILMPSMLKTAFGYADQFSTLYAFDGARRSDMNWTYIAYPGPGFYPHPLLRDNTAWSVSLNNQKCKAGPAESISITISKLDEHYAVTDKSTADVVAVAQSPNSGWPCIIFRPVIKGGGAGKFVVQVSGIRAMNGSPAPLSYLVDVRDMDDSGSKTDSSDKSDRKEIPAVDAHEKRNAKPDAKDDSNQ